MDRSETAGIMRQLCCPNRCTFAIIDRYAFTHLARCEGDVVCFHNRTFPGTQRADFALLCLPFSMRVVFEAMDAYGAVCVGCDAIELARPIERSTTPQLASTTSLSAIGHPTRSIWAPRTVKARRRRTHRCRCPGCRYSAAAPLRSAEK